jgi:hypothetical protein
MFMRLYTYGTDGNYLTYTLTGVQPSNESDMQGMVVPSDWTKYVGTVVAPSNAVEAALLIYANWDTTGVTDLADFRLEEMVEADLIVDGSVSAKKILVNSTGNEAGNTSGAAIVFDPFNESPISITDKVTGRTAFAVTLVDGEAHANITGTGGENFIKSVQAIDEDVIKLINPKYGVSASVKLNPGTITNNNYFTLPSITTNGMVSISINVLAYPSTSSTVGNQKIFTLRRNSSTGTVLKTWNSQASVGNPVSLIVGYVDNSAPATEVYVLTVSDIAGGHGSPKMAITEFTALTPILNQNTLSGNVGSGIWRDADTGYTEQWGRLIDFDGNDQSFYTKITFAETFSEVYGVQVTTISTSQNGTTTSASMYLYSESSNVNDIVTAAEFFVSYSTNISGIFWRAQGKIN